MGSPVFVYNASTFFGFSLVQASDFQGAIYVEYSNFKNKRQNVYFCHFCLFVCISPQGSIPACRLMPT